MSPTDCTCSTCCSMCAESVCMPTPAQVLELERRGYQGRLAFYDPRGPQGQQRPRFIAPAPKGREGQILPTTSGYGACTFYDGERCELHALGLKPEEGRLAHHDRDPMEVRHLVYMTWLQPGPQRH